METSFTRLERREIAGRARTLHERLDGPPNDPGENPPNAERLLDAWAEVFPDEESFTDRLARAGVTRSEVREYATATRWPADEPLPEWIADLESLFEYVTAAGIDDDYPFTVPDGTPFRELLAPVAGYAYDRLPSEVVPTDALDPMVEWFFDRLELLSARVLYVEFQSYLEPRAPELARGDPAEFDDPAMDFDDPPTTYYETFIEAMFDVGLKNLCLEYPVLARRLTLVVNQWVDAVTELSRRLRDDRSALNARFDVQGPVTKLDPLAEDAHAGGRVPVRVGFESGTVIYKPRDVGGGVAFYTILDRLDDHLATPSFETPTYLRREDYGWMEQVSYRDPEDEAAVRRYYERAGVVSCLGYALSLGDCQFENVVAAGEYPTVVDAETIFTPRVDPDASLFSTEVTQAAFTSVLVTGLFPYSSGAIDDERLPHVAGFGVESERQPLHGRTRPTIENANTDVMSVGTRTPTVDGRSNTPTLEGVDRPPRDYVDAIFEGFERTYETIRELHADGRFFAEVADEELLDGVETRVIYRPTNSYHAILRSSTALDPLRDGGWLTVELDELALPFFGEWTETDDLWPVCEAERRGLRRFDIPRLSTTPGGTTAFHDGTPLGVPFEESGYERARRRVASFDSADRDRQTSLIRRSLTDPENETPPSHSVPVTDERLREEACELFDEALDGIADAPGDDWVVWFATESDLTLNPADESVYHGRCGVALAGAALYAATGENRYRQAVADLLSPVIEELGSETAPFELGGTNGVGSVVYGLSVVADLLGDDRYRRHADEAVHAVTDDLLADDEDFDVMDGSAGTLLGLLAHYERHGCSAALERARACGERLLDGRTAVGGYRVWETNDDDPLTGFSHGSAGIAYALARLAALTDEPRYVDAVREALEFEAALYDPDRNNWDHGWSSGRYMDRWCHGRSGIALARVGIADSLGESVLPTRPEEVLPAVAEQEPKRIDDLCCGNLGRVETLLAGARYVGREPSGAVELTGRCLARKERDGRFAVDGRTWSADNPMFYKGLSGVAYTLLRVRDPDALPCVLLFE